MEPICLDEDEVAALREVLAALAVLDNSASFREMRKVEITQEMWQDMLLRPAQRLRRITTPRLRA